MSEIKGPRAIGGERLDKRGLDDFADRLRESCAPWAATVAAEPHECPSADRLWEAAAGQLPSSKSIVIVDHLAACPQCAGAYRLAVEMQSEFEVPPQELAPRRNASPWRHWMAAAAALVVVALGLVIWQNAFQPEPVPGLRGRTRPVIEFSVPEHAPLPAMAFTLRWDLAQDAISYDVDVYAETPDLPRLAQVRQWKDTSYTVPLAALEGLPEGASILWRVEAHMPDGQRESYTHVTRLQR